MAAGSKGQSKKVKTHTIHATAVSKITDEVLTATLSVPARSTEEACRIARREVERLAIETYDGHSLGDFVPMAVDITKQEACH
jgi:hypothetical protein